MSELRGHRCVQMPPGAYLLSARTVVASTTSTVYTYFFLEHRVCTDVMYP